jgi:hypothetical protein
MPDARCARSLVCELGKAHKHSHHGHTGTARHSPRNGFTGSFVLFPGTGLSCPRHRRKSASADLTPASGRQNHTTSPSATSSVRLCAPRVHRIPHPTFVTIAKRPSWRVWNGKCSIAVSTKRNSKIFFATGLDRRANQFAARVSEAIRGTGRRKSRMSPLSFRSASVTSGSGIHGAAGISGEMDSGPAPDGASRNDAARPR